MASKPEFDLKAAHKYFSANCFNRAWDLLDKNDRTPQEDEEMIRLSLTSHYHWTQREDFTDTKASIGFWQIARIYAVIGQAENAARYGQLCLEASQKEGVAPFYQGYAYEALARAAAAAGDKNKMQSYLEKANQTAGGIKDADEKDMLLADLKTIHL